MDNNKDIYKGKRAKSRKQILHAAKCLFEEEGIENVTFNQIAEKVDMSRSTIFNHFATINDLMMAIFDEEINELEEHCTKQGDGVPCQGRKLILTLFDKLIEDTAYYPGLTTRLTNNTILSGGKDNAIVRIENMVMDNLPKDIANEETVTIILGAYYGMVNHYHSNNLKFNIDEMKNKFHKMLDLIYQGEA